MVSIKDWTDLFLDSCAAFGRTFMAAVPGIMAAILILLIGWIIAKLASGGVAKLLKALKFDLLSEKIGGQDMLEKANIKLTASGIIGKFVYWVLMLLVLITASETLGWDAVSNEISKLISYMPTLLSAILIFVVGFYFASIVRDIIRGATSSLGISTGKLISGFVFYLLLIMITLTAMEQGGIDTTVITSNMLIILGAILAAAAISYGFASRTILSNLLATFFSRRTFKVGTTIEVDGVRGEILEVSSISVTIKNGEKEKVIIPTHELISQKVRIIE